MKGTDLSPAAQRGDVATVRPASPADVPAIVTLVNAAYEVESFFVEGPRTSEEEVRRCLVDGRFLVLACPGSIVGAVHLTREGVRGEFGLLAVAPERQGKGLGGRLVDAAEKELAAGGVRWIEIRVVSRRRELVPWYARRGYREVWAEPFSARRPVKLPVYFIVMRKELALTGAVEV